jgi:hypothetical protein
MMNTREHKWQLTQAIAHRIDRNPEDPRLKKRSIFKVKNVRCLGECESDDVDVEQGAAKEAKRCSCQK